MPRIAILAWGSLVKNPDGDPALGQTPLAIVDEWKQVGPRLKIEYSRISKGNRLTLVIDPNGTENSVFVAESACITLNDAAENLRAREGCTHPPSIGRMLKNGPSSASEPEATIRTWLNQTAFDGVVWTALPPKFREINGKDFTEHAAIKFLESLAETEREKAFRYFVETPDPITTNLRTKVIWPEAAAVHEAGHFVVATGLGRAVTRLSRVPVDDRPGQRPAIGCVYANINEPQPVLIACDLAGAWAQVTFMPESVATEKVPIFRNGILVPTKDYYLYSWTGWVEDVTPVRSTMRLDPAVAAAHGLPTAAEITRLDLQVGAFFTRADARQAVDLVSHALVATDIIIGQPLTALEQAVRAILPPAVARAALLAGF